MLRLEADPRKKLVEAKQAEDELAELVARGPIREETIRLRYADAEEVARTIQGILGMLDLGLNDEAGVLLAEHEDDLQALWPYGRLLWRLRVDGGSPDTRAAFDAAIQANPYVVSYLLDPDSIPFDRPPHFALHSREEAAYVAETLADAFAATDGALDWLAAQKWRFPSRSRRGRRGR